VAADGVSSPTLRALGWPSIPKSDLVVTVTREVRTSASRIDSELGREKIHLYFGIRDLVPMGYAWLFPKDDVVTVGWGCRVTHLRRARGGFRAFLGAPQVLDALDGGQTLMEKRHLVPIGERSQLVHDQVLGVGDAIGCVDPLTGKGIPYAILSGRLAGELVGKAVRAAEPNALPESYIEGLREMFLGKFERKRAMLGEVFASDDRLMEFLRLWQHHRSTEIVDNGLFGPKEPPTGARSPYA